MDSIDPQYEYALLGAGVTWVIICYSYSLFTSFTDRAWSLLLRELHSVVADSVSYTNLTLHLNLHLLLLLDTS